MDEKNLKGIIVFYINFSKDDSRNQEQFMSFIRDTNKLWIERTEKEGYGTMFVPTVGEASRIEKIDFDFPFPRFLPATRRNVNATSIEDNKESTCRI